ncbi:hypothetical protein GCM10022286_30570 [Gryllotalpicola daejeonensis]|uniref:Peptidase C51 domain-containing protein n=1 Tax=Gryllotalpicola daejeonensis TaxID=993087 RepID=A0ABP7ZNR3_9MICO
MGVRSSPRHRAEGFHNGVFRTEKAVSAPLGGGQLRLGGGALRVGRGALRLGAAALVAGTAIAVASVTGVAFADVLAHGGGDENGTNALVVPGGFAPGDPAHAPTATGLAVARLALAQLGQDLDGPNSVDGRDFGASSSLPGAWCAAFASWVWAEEGLDTAGLNGWAGSFLSYGIAHGTYRTTEPRVGDAALFALNSAAAASAAEGRLGNTHRISHVGIVVAVSDTTVTVVNGDWGDGAGGTRRVRLSAFPLARSDAGDFAPEMRQYLAGYVAAAATAPASR